MKKKKYILVEFPYPSGAGLHVGHVWGYTAGDVLARFYRANGYEVIFPMGWDAFGLPTENYAIKTNRKPQDVTKENIAVFKSQLKSLGMSFDWKREINTADPAYYKWTQWIFIQLFKNGLAYKAKMPINWCPFCKTGLANEEVLANGTHERCGSKVIQKDLEQWVLKITDYAGRLYSDLDKVDWPEHIKVSQRNWIGKSSGAWVDFEVKGERVSVFTTRLDTIYGVTALVLAPEHPLVQRVLKEGLGGEELAKYVGSAKVKSDFQRSELTKEKTGVLTSLHAVNPISGREIPVWVADYVVPWYGKGAIMLVPAHDERDNEFAKKYNIPSVQVISDRNRLINSGPYNGKPVDLAKKEIVSYLKEHDLGDNAVIYHLRDWVFSRQHYWGEPIPMVFCDKCASLVKTNENGQDSLAGWFPLDESCLPLVLPTIDDYKPTGDGRSPLEKDSRWINVKCPNCGRPAKRETDTMPNWAGSNWYFLRYLDNLNHDAPVSKSIEGKYMPIDLYLGGAEHTNLHLLYSRFIYKFLYDIGYVNYDEPYKVRINRGIILGEDGRKMSKSYGNVVNPTDLVSKVGPDALRMYELFLGPLEGTYAWSTKSLLGVRRFVDRVYKIGQYIRSKKSLSESSPDARLNDLVSKVTQDISKLKFHTAIASLMEYSNYMCRGMTMGGGVSSYKTFIRLMAPLAPFITEEIWHMLGEEGSVHKQPWPERGDMSYLASGGVSVVVQLDGKLQRVLTLPKDASESEDNIINAVRKDMALAKKIYSKKVKKTVFIPGKLINFVT